MIQNVREGKRRTMAQEDQPLVHFGPQTQKRGKVIRVSDLRKKSKREPRTYLGKKIFCRRREGKTGIFGEH